MKVYLIILIILFGLWHILLGYFPFLLCLLFVFLFVLNVLISYQGMKTTTITSQIDQSIVEREEDIHIRFLKHMKTIFPIGKIIIDYCIFDTFDECLKQDQIIIDNQECLLSLSMNHSGYYYVKVNTIYCYDILQCLYKKHDCHITVPFYVFPSMKSMSPLLHTQSKQDKDSIEYASHQGEDYSEVFDIRDYHEDDSLRHIHWKASLKRNELLVKVGSEPIVQNIIIAIEIKQIDLENDKKLDRFYSLCFSLLQKQIPFEILCFDQHEQITHELITNDLYFKECMKRILKNPPHHILESFYASEDQSLYWVESHQVEVLNK